MPNNPSASGASNFENSRKTMPTYLRPAQNLRLRAATYKNHLSFSHPSQTLEATSAVTNGVTGQQRKGSSQTINASDIDRFGTWNRCRSALGKAKSRLVSEDFTNETKIPRASSARSLSLNLTLSKSRLRKWLQSTPMAADIPEQEDGNANELTSQNSQYFDENESNDVKTNKISEKNAPLDISNRANVSSSPIKIRESSSTRKAENLREVANVQGGEVPNWIIKLRGNRESPPVIMPGSYLEDNVASKDDSPTRNLETENPLFYKDGLGQKYSPKQKDIEAHKLSPEHFSNEENSHSSNKVSRSNPYVIALNSSTDSFVNESADSGASEPRHDIYYMSSNDDSSFNDWKKPRKQEEFRPLSVVKSSPESSWHFEWDGKPLKKPASDTIKPLENQNPPQIDSIPITRQNTPELPQSLGNVPSSTHRNTPELPERLENVLVSSTRQRTLEAFKRMGQHFSNSSRFVSSNENYERKCVNTAPSSEDSHKSNNSTNPILEDTVPKEPEASLFMEVRQVSRYTKQNLRKLHGRLTSSRSGENSIKSIESGQPKTTTSDLCEDVPQVSTLSRIFNGSWIEEKIHSDSLWHTLGLDGISQCRKIRQEFLRKEEFSQFSGVQNFLLAGYRVDGAFHNLRDLIKEKNRISYLEDASSGLNEDLGDLNDTSFQSSSGGSIYSNLFYGREEDTTRVNPQLLTRPERKALDKSMWVKVIRCQQRLVTFKTDPSTSNHQDLLEVLLESMEFSRQNYKEPAIMQLSDYTSQLSKLKTQVYYSFSQLASLSHVYATFLDYSSRTQETLESLKRTEKEMVSLNVLITHPLDLLRDIGRTLDSLETDFEEVVPEMISLAETAVISMKECANTFDQFEAFIKENYREGPIAQDFTSIKRLIGDSNSLLDQMQFIHVKSFKNALIDLRSCHESVIHIAMDYDMRVKSITNEVTKRLMKVESSPKIVAEGLFEPIQTSDSQGNGQKDL